MALNANTVWADGPSGTPYWPEKSLIRRWGTSIESNVLGGGTTQAIGDEDFVMDSTIKTVATSVVFTAPHTLTLPPASDVLAGFEVVIDDSFGAITPANTLTIDCDGTDTLFPGTAASYVIAVGGSTLKLISDGVSRWGVGWTNSATAVYSNGFAGGINRTVHSKLGDIFSVCDFNAVGDNNIASVTRNDAAFAAAVTAAVLAGGAQILIPRGTYYVSQAIAVLSSGVSFIGEGPNATVIKTTSVTDDIFRFGDGVTQIFRVGVRDVAFATSVTKTAGAAVKFNLVQDSWFEDWFSDGMFESCRQLNCTVSFIAHGYAINTAPTNGRGVYISGGNDQYMHDILITSNPSSQARCGYEIESTGAVWMDSCGALQCGTGCIALPAAGHTITWMFTTRCAMDTGTGNGWLFQVVSGSSINGWTSSHDWAASNAGDGVAIVVAAGGGITGLSFIGMRVVNNGYDGINTSGAVQDFAIQNCKVSSNSQNSVGTRDGIFIGAGAQGVTIHGTRSGGIFSNTQRNAITLEAGATNHVLITGNDNRLNLNKGIVDGATGADKLIFNNLDDDGTPAIKSFDAVHTVGSNVASAATINLDTATGYVLGVTGTTTITGITLSPGKMRVIVFAAALKLTNSASLVLPGGADITTAAGDTAIVYGAGTGVVKCISYSRADSGYSESSVDSTVAGSLTTGTTANVHDTASTPNIISIQLQPGEYDLSAVANFKFAAATSATVAVASISSASATLDATAGRYGELALASGGQVVGARSPSVALNTRVVITAVTTFYLVVQATFTVSTLAAWGKLSARRVR